MSPPGETAITARPSGTASLEGLKESARTILWNCGIDYSEGPP